jgi:hypothetical protein
MVAKFSHKKTSFSNSTLFTLHLFETTFLNPINIFKIFVHLRNISYFANLFPITLSNYFVIIMSNRKRENELFEHYSKLVAGGEGGEDGEGSNKRTKLNKSTDGSPIPEYLKGI